MLIVKGSDSTATHLVIGGLVHSEGGTLSVTSGIPIAGLGRVLVREAGAGSVGHPSNLGHTISLETGGASHATHTLEALTHLRFPATAGDIRKHVAVLACCKSISPPVQPALPSNLHGVMSLIQLVSTKIIWLLCPSLRVLTIPAHPGVRLPEVSLRSAHPIIHGR